MPRSGRRRLALASSQVYQYQQRQRPTTALTIATTAKTPRHTNDQQQRWQLGAIAKQETRQRTIDLLKAVIQIAAKNPMNEF
ncbi:hypothetical protein [Nostoc sp. ATCC 53789]|nr:hypothetical protein [Nostoc sp. ATCC 53789]QHG21060.1 hypothetical protein GJB62_34985 [Nostoc sp. ATCC 53789]